MGVTVNPADKAVDLKQPVGLSGEPESPSNPSCGNPEAALDAAEALALHVRASKDTQPPEAAATIEAAAGSAMDAVELRRLLLSGADDAQLPTASPAKAAAAKQKAADGAALGVLRGAVMVKDEAARQEILAWVKNIELKCDNGESFTVLEHTSFSYLLSSGFFGAEADNAAEKTTLNQDAQAALTRALTASWKNLTGKQQPQDKLLTRLPKSVLKKTDRRARLYHAASFLPIGDRKAQIKESRLLRDFVPETKDIIVLTATALACAFSSTACQMVGAGILSYAVIGLSESWQHNHLAHPRSRTAGGWIIKGPKEGASWLERGLHKVIAKVLKKKLEFTKISHAVVHHGLTYSSSYTEMFKGPEHQAKVDAFVDGLDDKEAQRIYRENYGSTLDHEGLLSIMASIAPQTAALIAAGIAFGASAWAYLPLLLIAAVYPFTMQQVHPFLHNDEHEARKEAGPIMTKILNSRWAAWACRNHWLHHKAPANYNLSFPGADALLGTLMQPNLEDLFKMADEKTLHY